MSTEYRQQIEAVPGGRFIVLALDALADEIHRAPFRIGGVTIRTGVGSPEGVVVGTVGDLYLRTDGGTSTTLAVKESGVNTSTGWILK